MAKHEIKYFKQFVSESICRFYRVDYNTAHVLCLCVNANLLGIRGNTDSMGVYYISISMYNNYLNKLGAGKLEQITESYFNRLSKAIVKGIIDNEFKLPKR